MSDQSQSKPQSQSTTRRYDPNYRAPLRDILDSIRTGRHVEMTHIYDKDQRRRRVKVVQLADGLRLVDDMGISETGPATKDDRDGNTQQ